VVVALSPQLSFSKPKEGKRQPGTKIRNLKCIRYHILYVLSIVQKGFIHGNDRIICTGDCGMRRLCGPPELSMDSYTGGLRGASKGHTKINMNDTRAKML
jgi:hypothetical protein